jgi:hypothetical protein
VVKKGCLIALGVAGALGLLLVGTCYYAAMSYEKDHPELVASSSALLAAENAVMSDREGAALGNSDQARAAAKQFSLAMKLARQAFFTGKDDSKFSLTEGNFVTYVQVLPDKCAFIVHVPQLRNYAAEAKIEMAELAWRMAAGVLDDNKIAVKELAVGIRGPMSYGHIIVGPPTPVGGQASAGKPRTIDRDALYPFFVPVAATPKPKS